MDDPEGIFIVPLSFEVVFRNAKFHRNFSRKPGKKIMGRDLKSTIIIKQNKITIRIEILFVICIRYYIQEN